MHNWFIGGAVTLLAILYFVVSGANLSGFTNPMNTGATPPGTTSRSYSGSQCVTANADQEFVLLTDDKGMIAECSIKNTHVSAGLSYTVVTKDLNGQTTTTGPTNLAAAGIFNAGHGTGGIAAVPKFIKSMSIKLKSTVADTPATFTMELCAIHTGTALLA